MSRHTLVATCVALAWGLASPPSLAAARAKSSEGRILIAAGSPLLIDEGNSVALVGTVPAVSLIGFEHLIELAPGDHVRYRWREQVGQVRLAEEIEVDPAIACIADLKYPLGELEVALGQGALPVLVDTRARSEFAAGHLPGALHLAPASASTPLRAVRRDEVIVVYGSSSRDRAPFGVARQLRDEGWTKVKIFEGGVRAWLAADLPLEVLARDLPRPLPAVAAWIIVDVRPRALSSMAAARGAISIPPEAFRWQDFDGSVAVESILFMGRDDDDPAPRAMADRVRRLRSARPQRTPLRIQILEGGFAAWRARALPETGGGELPVDMPASRSVAFEVTPAEFDQIASATGSHRHLLLDVRRSGASPEPGRMHIALEDLPYRLTELPRDREIVAYCSFGLRARVAAELLRQSGFKARFTRQPH